MDKYLRLSITLKQKDVILYACTYLDHSIAIKYTMHEIEHEGGLHLIFTSICQDTSITSTKITTPTQIENDENCLDLSSKEISAHKLKYINAIARHKSFILYLLKK